MAKLYFLTINDDVPAIRPLETEHLGTAIISGVSYYLVPVPTEAASTVARPPSATASPGVGERHGSR